MIEYGLLGAKLGHSYSKPIHNLLAGYSYELYAVTPEELKVLMESRQFRGLNVTIPYKKDVLPYLDEISPEVHEVGSANTLVMGADGKLRGYNTDLQGFLSMADRSEAGAKQQAGFKAQQQSSDNHGNVQDGDVDEAQRNHADRREAEQQDEGHKQGGQGQMGSFASHDDTSVQVLK